MAETLTICHDCNQSTSGRCWRHSTITVSLCDHAGGPCSACGSERQRVPVTNPDPEALS